MSSSVPFSDYKVVCLAGGVGGAKLADGLAQILPPQNLTVIVNTGDDFHHLGLTICPDLDTVMYTLADVANTDTGWGRADESWRVLTEISRLGGPEWFRLGDLDLATHLIRADWLARGETLTAVTRHLTRRFQIPPEILPMSDRPAPTQVETEEGVLPFQTWFVQKKWQPAVKRIILPDDARATPAVMNRLENADLVLIAPSNPFVSIDPILNAYPVREMITDLPQAVVAVTPIIGGEAVKGPAAKMMREMGLPVTATAVARHYGDVIDGFVYDQTDAESEAGPETAVLHTDAWMKTRDDRSRLAQDVLKFAASLAANYV